MSSLSVYHVSSPDIPNKVLTHFEDIASTLAEQGVRFDRWQAAAKIQPGASQEEVIGAYQEQIDKLMTERGYITVDVVSLNSCLLYTSPSPRDGLLSRMPSSA